MRPNLALLKDADDFILCRTLNARHAGGGSSSHFHGGTAGCTITHIYCSFPYSTTLLLHVVSNIQAGDR